MIKLSEFYRLSRTLHKMSMSSSRLAETCPDELREYAKMQQELAALIEDLPGVNDRLVMRLSVVKGMNSNEIAEALGISERNYFYCFRRGKQQLAEMHPDKVCL